MRHNVFYIDNKNLLLYNYVDKLINNVQISNTLTDGMGTASPPNYAQLPHSLKINQNTIYYELFMKIYKFAIKWLKTTDIINININEITPQNAKMMLEKIKVKTLREYFLHHHIGHGNKSSIKLYKLKKQSYINNLYIYDWYSHFATIIQKNYRKHLCKFFMRLKGPAVNPCKRHICHNSTDFISLENITEIPFEYFISIAFHNTPSLKVANVFTEETTPTNIYGFNIISLYNYLIIKKEVKNPYTRELIPNLVYENLLTLINIGEKFLNIKLNLNIDDALQHLGTKKQIEFKIIELFQEINQLDFYIEPNWFIELDRKDTINFLQKFINIWKYDANLCDTAKKEICPPDGNPFFHFNIHKMKTETNIYVIKNKMVAMFANMLHNNISVANKKLIAIYIILALKGEAYFNNSIYDQNIYMGA